MLDEHSTDDKKPDLATLDLEVHDDGASSSRMLGGLVLTAILQPIFAAWLLFQGYGIFQILMIVWLFGSSVFVFILVVTDWIAEKTKAGNRSSTAAGPPWNKATGDSFGSMAP